MKIFLQSLFITLFAIGCSHADGIVPLGSGTLESPYQITSLDHLLWLSTTPDSWAAHFVQGADIDASLTQSWNAGEGFSPIGNDSLLFRGTYDGQNHSISSLFINQTDRVYGGIFGVLQNAEIRNLVLLNADIRCAGNVGILFGYDNGSLFENCHCHGSITATDAYAGGLGGSVNHTYILGCTTQGNATGLSHVGGLVGRGDYLTLFESGSQTVVNGAGEFVGGLLGACALSSIHTSFSSGDVSGSSNLGGLIGSSVRTSVSNCYSLSAVSGGGHHVGGLVGMNYEASVNNCYSKGSVWSPGFYVGGLVGESYWFASVNSSFWDVESSGLSGSSGGTGLSDESIRTLSTYTDLSNPSLNTCWDFVDNPFDDVANEDFWNMDPDEFQGYPFLSWQISASVPVSTPQHVILVSLEAGMQLSWDPVDNVTSYRVYSCETAYGEYGEDLTGEFTGPSWTTNNAGTKRYYRVTAVVE